MKTNYTATFSNGTIATRSSNRIFKSVSIVILPDGSTFGSPSFSSKATPGSMETPGSSDRRGSKSPCYNGRQKAALLKDAAEADKGIRIETVLL